MPHKNIIFITVVTLFVVLGQIFLKKGLKLIGELNIAGFSDFFAVVLRLIQNKFIIIGTLIAVTGAFLWLMVISRLELTVALPMASGIFYILLLLISWVFLGETITFLKILGISVIIFGIFLVSK